MRLAVGCLSAPEHQVSYAAGTGHGLKVESVEQVVWGDPEPLTAADRDWSDGDVHLVDEIRIEELADGVHTATESDVLAVGGILSQIQRDGGRGVDEVERSVGEGETRSRIVGQDEYGCVERWRFAPPARPIEIRPRASIWPELVAPHDLGADVAVEVAGGTIVEAAGAAGIGSIRKTGGRQRPAEEVTRVNVPEGAFEALALSGAKAVQRYAKLCTRSS